MAFVAGMIMQKEREICSLICRSNGIKAKDIALTLKMTTLLHYRRLHINNSVP